jgi:phosphoenolpyruvate carboxykinase (GTP)
VESPIGYLPKPEDIHLEGLDVSLDTLKNLLSVDKELWREEAKGIHEFYEKFGDKLPAKLKEELAKLEKNLA